MAGIASFAANCSIRQYRLKRAFRRDPHGMPLSRSSAIRVNFATQRSKSSDVLGGDGGGPRRIRTPDPLIRSQVLYPAELSVRQERHLSPRARLCKRGSPGQSQSSHINRAGPPWAGRSQTACRPLRSRPGSACHHAREQDRRKSTGPARCRPCARRPERA